MWELIVAISIIAVGFIVASIFIYSKIKNYNLKTIIIKSIASALFVILGLFLLFIRSHQKICIFVVLGLLCGLLGDIALGFRHVYIEHKKLLTKIGFLCFASGHIFYVVGLYLQFYIPHSSFLYILLPFVFALILGLLLLVMEKKMNLHYGSIRKIIPIYGFLLFSTFCNALSLCIMNNFNQLTLTLLFVGALLFAISDTSLCITYFGENTDTATNNLINSISYYLAQYMIAFSIFFI